MAKTNIVDWKTITSFVTDAFVGYGIPRKDAEICADILLESDKRGIESHGVNRFKPSIWTASRPESRSLSRNLK